jgi:hypothetical protein
MAALRYALGMELALADPTSAEPGGFTRESLLAQVVSQIALVDDYELRLILHSDMPVDCPHDLVGEFVLMVGEGVGGPIAADRADAIITEAEMLGRSGELSEALAPVVIGPALDAERSLILPPHCFVQIAAFPAGHPLEGVALVPAVEVKQLLDKLGALEQTSHLQQLIDFCIRTRVVLSVHTPR